MFKYIPKIGYPTNKLTQVGFPRILTLGLLPSQPRQLHYKIFYQVCNDLKFVQLDATRCNIIILGFFIVKNVQVNLGQVNKQYKLISQFILNQLREVYLSRLSWQVVDRLTQVNLGWLKVNSRLKNLSFITFC